MAPVRVRSKTSDVNPRSSASTALTSVVVGCFLRLPGELCLVAAAEAAAAAVAVLCTRWRQAAACAMATVAAATFAPAVTVVWLTLW